MAYFNFNVQVSFKGNAVATPMVFSNMASEMQKLIGAKTELVHVGLTSATVRIENCAMTKAQLNDFLAAAYSKSKLFEFRVFEPI